MILTVDIGNTTISFGVFQEKKKPVYISYASEKYSRTALRTFLGRNSRHIKYAIVCSVVPKRNRSIKSDIKALCGCSAQFIGIDIKVDICTNYKRINQLGLDRVVALCGGMHLFKTPFLIIDFGTAITFDVVNKKGCFDGGLIVPGVETAFHTLLKKGALLPKKFALSKPRSFIGTSTKSCLNSGAIFGFATLTDGIINRFKSLYGNKLCIVSTGGASSLIRPYCKNTIVEIPYLTLQSLALIAHGACL